MRKDFIFVVMCTCAFFTTQCDGVGNLPDAIYVAPGEPEDLPVEDNGSHELDDITWSYKYADELNERVKCSSPIKTGEKYELVGKWKLILRINGADTVDCSCEEVVYNFKPDQMLTVSTGNETADDVAYEYDWGYPFICLTLNPRPNLRMGSSAVYCRALPKMMYVYPQYEEVYVKVDPENEVLGLWPLFEIKWIFIRID